MMWHQRLGHFREKGLQSLKGKGMVEGMFNCNSDFNFYEDFLYGTNNLVKFPFGATRAMEILELIQSGVFGLALVPSLGGSSYYVSFIDYLSRNTWLYFLKKELKAFSKFKEFKDLVKNQKKK